MRNSWYRKILRRTRHPATSLWKQFLLLVIGFFFLFAAVFLIWVMTIDMPSVTGFHNRRVAESTKIFDKTGEVLLYDVHGTVRRTIVPLNEMSRHVKNATIAIEDAEFYTHRGIKPTAIARAVWTNIITGKLLRGQGGSTITQQVVKNTLLSPEKTITRKIKEWILALRLENNLTKDQILEIYLNETPYGGTIYGVEEASRYFFGKKASDITLVESAYLAALPQAPTYYSPYGNHRDDLELRKNLVLLKMKENGFITEEEYQKTLTEQVVFSQNEENGIRAPHFVFYIREYLEEKYGTDMVSEGGLQVITTLDWELQEQAEEIVRSHALRNESTFNAENAALVAIDPKNGHILTMVGSRGYFDDAIDGKYNIALAERQPGSSFKPFVYATAFAKGYTPDTVVFDVPTQFNANCAPNDFETHDACYAPGNYDSLFRGPMTLRDALAQSVNIPAVKALYLSGVRESLDTAERLGITTLTRPIGEYGLPLVLGGGEVTLLEMVSAYATFAHDGVRNPHVGILKVTDANGKVLEEYEENKEQALDAEVARYINNILSDNTARTPAFGSSSALLIPGYDVAAKTGTTNDYRDVWIVGYTPTIAVGAWAGNNDNSPMEKKVAGFIIAPLWNEFMRVALAHVPTESFIPPTPKEEREGPAILYGDWSGNGSGVHSILYWVNKDNPLGPSPSNPALDSQFSLWEYGVLAWLTGSTTTPLVGAPTPPTETFVVPHTQPLTIQYPTPGMNHPIGTLLSIRIHNPYGSALKKVAYSVNGVFIGSSDKEPFSISFVPVVSGPTIVTVVASGTMGEVRSQVSFFVQ